MMAGQQQCVFGPGDGHIQQPALLVDAPLLELTAVLEYAVGQLLSISDMRGVQDRDAGCAGRCAVTTQQRRQVSGFGEPGAGRRSRRKDTC
jgi:hypothetical protein